METTANSPNNSKPDTTERRRQLIRQAVRVHDKDFSLRDIVRTIREQGLWPTPTPQEAEAVLSMYADCIVINEISDCQKELSIEKKETNDFSVESYARKLVDLTFRWDDPPKHDEAKDDDDQNV